MGYKYLKNKKEGFNRENLILLRILLRAGRYFKYPESEYILKEVELELMED